MLRHLGRARIKFMQLHVPHILRHNEDPTTKDFVGTWVGILPLASLSNTNIV